MRTKVMRTALRPLVAAALATLIAVASLAAQSPQSPSSPPPDGFKFKSGVELVNVTATVTDRDGRFVPGLTKDDFTVYDNGTPQDITQFSNERVPVSLGIL